MPAPAGEYLAGQYPLQVLAAARQQGAGVLGPRAEHERDLGRIHAVARVQLQCLAFQLAQAHHGLPGDEPSIVIPLTGMGHDRIGARASGRPAAEAFHPRERVEPWPERPGIAEARDMRVGDEEGITERGLRRVAVVQHEQAVLVETLAVGVVQGGERPGVVRPQRLGKQTVAHGQKLDAPGAFFYRIGQTGT